VGFTTLSEQRDSEDVRELLSRYFDTARTVIDRYGGSIEKFIGDAVMAVWGVPATQEDDAERAVRAGLELVDAVMAFGQEVGAFGLRARAGVLTGEAAVTLGASGEGMVAGDLVNTASRVQSVAEPGTVYVGETTKQATEAAILYEDTGSHELKGKQDSLQLWHAIRVVAGRRGALRVSGLEPPFVGRERELRLVKELLHASGEESRARLLSVAGVAGVGKSRLAWEFEKYTDGLSEAVYWHRGRCLAYGEGVTYWALAEMVRMRAGISEGEATEAAKEKLRSTVVEFVPDDEDRRWVEPRLAQLLGLQEGSATDPRDLFAAWRLFFERLSKRQLTVLVFEDIQWADSALLDFIEYLLEWSRDHAIYVLTLGRPDIAERRPGWGTGKRGVTSLYLEPLSAAAMAELLDGMVPGLSDDLRGRILARAAGIPLYAVETVRMLLDRGLLVEEGGAYRATAPLEALEVPESLHALIAARLDSLAPAERRVIQDAAVLGKSFSVAALCAIGDMAFDEAEPTLVALVRKEILATQADPRSPEHGQYVFLQDVVQRVAYETMARRERKQRHLAAAGYLASAWTGEDEVAEVVAAHLVEAYESDPNGSDAAEIKERARSALVRAGEHAASLAAGVAALRYFEQALELSGTDASRAELHVLAGDMARLQGQLAVARSHYETAIRLHNADGNIGAAARADAKMAELDFVEDKLDLAIDRMEKVMSVLSAEEMTTDEERADVALASAQLGRIHFMHGNAEQAALRTEFALTVAERLDLPELLSAALVTKSLLLFEMGGRPKEGGVLLDYALNVALANNLHEGARRAYHNLAQLRIRQDRFEEALELLEGSRAQGEKLGDRQAAMMALEGTIQCLVELGRWDEAMALAPDPNALEVEVTFWVPIALLQLVWPSVWRGDMDMAQRLVAASAPILEHSEDPVNRAALATAQALLDRALGRPGSALAKAEAALDGTRSFPMSAWMALIEAAEAAIAAGELAKVEDFIRVAASIFPRGGKPSWEAHALRWRALLGTAQNLGEEEVLALLQSGASGFETLHMPFWRAVTQLELGEFLVGRDRRDEATAHLDAARLGFEHLGARPWLAKVDAVISSGPSATAYSRPA